MCSLTTCGLHKSAGNVGLETRFDLGQASGRSPSWGSEQRPSEEALWAKGGSSNAANMGQRLEPILEFLSMQGFSGC
jgi:hypothetical protein